MKKKSVLFLLTLIIVNNTFAQIMDIDFEIVGVYLPVENIDGPTWLAIGMWRSMEFFLFSGHFAAVLFSTMVIESGSQIMILILKALY